MAVLLLVLAASLSAGCKKKAGSSCSGSATTCLDPKTALVCRGEAFVEVPCEGPNGCAKYRDRAACDTTVASAGAPCMGEEDEYGCSADGKRALVCKSGRMVPWSECRGKSGCSIAARKPSCDTSIAAPGDLCTAQGAFACSGDTKEMLVCRDGKFDLHRHCRGARGCHEKAEALACDDTLSLVGDPCPTPGQTVCSVDGSSELICQQGMFTKSMSCRGGCVVTYRGGRPIECR